MAAAFNAVMYHSGIALAGGPLFSCHGGLLEESNRSPGAAITRSPILRPLWNRGQGPGGILAHRDTRVGQYGIFRSMNPTFRSFSQTDYRFVHRAAPRE